MSRLRIIVLGYIVRGPLGGMVWSNLQYLLGLARLGHDVYFVEDSDDYPSCYDPARDVVDADPTYGLGFAARELERIGLGERWAYWDAHTTRWLGPRAARIVEVCASADLLLNLCGINPVRPWLARIPVRVLTFAENIGTSRCAIPDDGLPWRPTRQPVVLDALPATPGPADGKFTTVMQWESYPAREYAGVRYGMKSDSFTPYLDLPGSAGRILELALGGPNPPRELLHGKGWLLRGSREPTVDVPTYLGYIRQSKAEFSVAKHAYVVTGSGWFSERSVTYLTSGRPVLVQDTGFSRWLPTGAGVIAFASPEEALGGIESINGRYALHCEAAPAVAEAYFDSRKVLPQLIEGAMSPAPCPGRGRVPHDANQGAGGGRMTPAR